MRVFFLFFFFFFGAYCYVNIDSSSILLISLTKSDFFNFNFGAYCYVNIDDKDEVCNFHYHCYGRKEKKQTGMAFFFTVNPQDLPLSVFGSTLKYFKDFLSNSSASVIFPSAIFFATFCFWMLNGRLPKCF